MSIEQIPAGLAGIAFILLIASLCASATARRDGLRQQATDDGEGRADG